MIIILLLAAFTALITALPHPQGDSQIGGISPPANTTNQIPFSKMLDNARANGKLASNWPPFPVAMAILTQPSAYLSFTTAGSPGLIAAQGNVINALDSEWNTINAADTVPESIATNGAGGEIFSCGSLGSDKQLVLDMLVEFKAEVTRYGTEDLGFDLLGNDGQKVGSCTLKVSSTD